MKRTKQRVLPVITTMALRQHMHLGTWCTIRYARTNEPNNAQQAKQGVWIIYIYYIYVVRYTYTYIYINAVKWLRCLPLMSYSISKSLRARQNIILKRAILIVKNPGDEDKFFCCFIGQKQPSNSNLFLFHGSNH